MLRRVPLPRTTVPLLASAGVLSILVLVLGVAVLPNSVGQSPFWILAGVAFAAGVGALALLVGVFVTLAQAQLRAGRSNPS